MRDPRCLRTRKCLCAVYALRRGQSYGDRSTGVEDPFGNQWWIATHIEDVPPEEMERRAAEAAQGSAGG